MTTNLAFLVMLAVFSGLSMNLLLQFGLGVRGIALNACFGRAKLLASSAILFVTVMLLWLVFTFARSVLFLGLLEYVVLFPASTLVFSILEYLTNHFILKNDGFVSGNAIFSGALSGTALFITLNVAGGLLEAIVLSLGFSGSILLVFIILCEIRRRSEMEKVPRSLRGSPLVLITMGLLMLVFSSGALMFYEVLGNK